MTRKKTKSTKRKTSKPSAATLARREERIAALAHALTVLIFATFETGGAA